MITKHEITNTDDMRCEGCKAKGGRRFFKFEITRTAKSGGARIDMCAECLQELYNIIFLMGDYSR